MLMIISNERARSKGHDELSRLELGLIIGLTLGVPALLACLTMCIIQVWRRRKHTNTSVQMSVISSKWDKAIDKAVKDAMDRDNEFARHFPDPVLRGKLMQGIFHDDVIQAFGDLPKESRDYIISWMKHKHGPSKANELPLIALSF